MFFAEKEKQGNRRMFFALKKRSNVDFASTSRRSGSFDSRSPPNKKDTLRCLSRTGTYLFSGFYPFAVPDDSMLPHLACRPRHSPCVLASSATGSARYADTLLPSRRSGSFDSCSPPNKKDTLRCLSCLAEKEGFEPSRRGIPT